ncbi:GATA Zn-finger-containing transcription factor [Spraguea lophii 42_110]|uniref:GATA Zn-finger-containing transcription factor n=1 Tax=Spraguea lophii (strain 42_110) TaxID=1358809 RepID=S7W7I3_SPRLO|nr:GATA Zn-finger-containing transcription factor [Spraguea lophii 42_110]
MTEYNFNNGIYKEKDEEEMDGKDVEDVEKTNKISGVDELYQSGMDNQIMKQKHNEYTASQYYGRSQVHPDYQYQRKQDAYMHENTHSMYSPRMPQFFSYPHHDSNIGYHFYDMNSNGQFIPNISSHDTMNTMRVIKEVRRKPKLRVCSNCVTTTTPSWRRSVDKKQLLCNACGLYQKLHHKPRPFATTPDGKTKALKTGFEKYKCLSCGITESRMWRKTPSNLPICHSCYIQEIGHHISNDHPSEIQNNEIYDKGLKGDYMPHNQEINYRRNHHDMSYAMYSPQDRSYANHLYTDQIKDQYSPQMDTQEPQDKQETKFTETDEHYKTPFSKDIYTSNYSTIDKQRKNMSYYRDDGYFYEQNAERKETTNENEKSKIVESNFHSDNPYNHSYPEKNFVNKNSPDRTEDH